MPDKNHQNSVLLVASEADLMSEKSDWLQSNEFACIPIASLMRNLASWTTSLLTGVDSTIHNIYHHQLVDFETMTLRYANAGDLSYAPIWKELQANGKQTTTIDWPITDEEDTNSEHHPPVHFHDDAHTYLLPEDEDLIRTCTEPIRQNQKKLELVRRLKILRARTRKTMALAKDVLTRENTPELTCLLIRDPGRLCLGFPAFREAQSTLLRTLIEGLGKDLNILIVENQLAESKQQASADTSSTLQLILRSNGLDQTQITKIPLTSITPAIRSLLGIPHPMGAALPDWPFLTFSHAEELPRPFPIVMETTKVNLQDIALNIVEMPTSTPEEIQQQSVLAQNIITQSEEKSLVDHRKNQWKQLADTTEALVTLRGTRQDYWMMAFVLDRLDETEKLKNHVENLQLVYGGETFARIAEAMVLKKHHQVKAVDILEDLNLEDTRLPLIASTAGRTAFQLGLEDKAEIFADLALKRNSFISADRILLATLKMKKGKHEQALQAIGQIGSVGGLVKWRLLRSQILIANDMLEDAERILQEILAENPLETKAQAGLEQIRKQRNI